MSLCCSLFHRNVKDSNVIIRCSLSPPLRHENTNLSQLFIYFSHSWNAPAAELSLALVGPGPVQPPPPDSSSLSTPASLNVICTAVLASVLRPRPPCVKLAYLSRPWKAERGTIASCVRVPCYLSFTPLLKKQLTSFSINYTKTMILAKDGLRRRFWSHLKRSLISVMKREQWSCCAAVGGKKKTAFKWQWDNTPALTRSDICNLE